MGTYIYQNSTPQMASELFSPRLWYVNSLPKSDFRALTFFFQIVLRF